MIQQIILILAALIGWIIDFVTSQDDKRGIRILRVVLLLVIFVAGGFAIYDSHEQRVENEKLTAKISDLARKPEIVLVANGYEVTTNRPIPCIATGGVYVLDFDFFNRSIKSASDATLTLILPDDLQVLNVKDWRRMSGTSLPSPDRPAPTLHVRNHYQTQLGRALFPQSMESVGRVMFVVSGEKVLTRSVFAEITSLRLPGSALEKQF